MPNFSLADRFKNAFNAFANRDPTKYLDLGTSYGYRPDRLRHYGGSEKSIVTSIITRIAIDAAAIDIQHVQLDDDGRFLNEVESGLSNVLSLEANLDQTGREFLQDAVYSLLDEGVVALVPIDTSFNPDKTDSFDILTMRTGEILQWYPEHIKMRVYNDRTGRREDLTLPKRSVAIIENPLYQIMNEPNSTLQRLKRKLALLDMTDEQTASGKLDLIVQLPYVIKSESRRAQAEARRKDIEMQLTGSKYGIAYTDGTEKIIQLNRSVDNQLMSQIEYLTNTLYGQLGITDEVIKGTADEKTMLNYYNRTIDPIVSAISTNLERKFLTKNARTRGQAIRYFRDPFKLVPIDNIAEIADKFTRNEIMTSNEIRQVIGMKPSDDPKADKLMNSNLNQPMEGADMSVPMDENGEYDEFEETYEENYDPMETPISEL